MVSRLFLGSLTFPLLLASLPAYAQATTGEDEEQVLEEVKVVSTRFANAALSAIEPEIRLSSEEIGAYGASTIEELLEQLGPEINSSRGRGSGGPVFLVNGVRISGFREIREYPPEAIERVDVLPEEAALKFGYSADQKVVNFVLKEEFSAITLEVEAGGPLQGDGFEREFEASYLKIMEGKRLSLDGEISDNSGILESDRGLSEIDEVGKYSLKSETDQAELGGTYHVPFQSGLRMTLSGDVTLSSSTSYQGLSDLDFVLPAASPFSVSGTDESFTRLIGVPNALQRDSDSLDANAAMTFIGEIGDWQFTSNTKAGRNQSESDTDRPPDASAYQAALDALDTGIGPDSDLTPFLVYRTEATERVSNTASTNFLLNGHLWSLPAGDVTTGLSVDLSHVDRTSETELDGVTTRSDLDRQIGKVQASFDFPLISSDMDVPGVEYLMMNLSASASEYSDFGSLMGFDGTVSWAPVEMLSFLASYTYEQGAPGMSDLGDTLSSTPNVEVFDYVTGQSVRVTQISGGNPDLQADERQVFKLSSEINPFEEQDFSLRFTYIDTKIDDPIGSLPGIDAAVQAVFPDRFVRDSDGNLISYDARPVNYVEETQRDFQTVISWRKTFASQKKAQERQGAAAGAPETPPPVQGGPPPQNGRAGPPEGGGPKGPPPGARGGGRGGPPGGGPRGGGRGGAGPGDRNGIRTFLNLRHDWHLEDERVLAEGYPVQDYLNGAAKGSDGGQSEHEVELRAGVFSKGIGGHASLKWQSGTEVLTGSTGEVLSFSDIVSTDMRIFYTFRQENPLVKEHDWLKGVRVSLKVDNIFDDVRSVKDSNGVIPSRYAADRLDPVGRAVFISVRKQF